MLIRMIKNTDLNKIYALERREATASIALLILTRKPQIRSS